MLYQNQRLFFDNCAGKLQTDIKKKISELRDQAQSEQEIKQYFEDNLFRFFKPATIKEIRDYPITTREEFLKILYKNDDFIEYLEQVKTIKDEINQSPNEIYQVVIRDKEIEVKATDSESVMSQTENIKQIKYQYSCCWCHSPGT